MLTKVQEIAKLTLSRVSLAGKNAVSIDGYIVQRTRFQRHMYTLKERN